MDVQERSRRRPFAVLGATVVAGVALILALAGVRIMHRDIDHANLVVRVPNAAGIEKGSVVWLSGVPVGVVAQIVLLRDGAVAIRCTVDPRITLPHGAQVAVTTSLYGDRRVEIVPRRAEKPDDNPAVAFVRAAEGLRPNPLDPLMHASARLQADAARVARTTAAHRAASLAAAAQLRTGLAALATRTQANSQRARLTLALPAKKVAALRVSPQLQLATQRMLEDARRARESTTALAGTLSDPVLRKALARDQETVQASLRAIRNVR